MPFAVADLFSKLTWVRHMSIKWPSVGRAHGAFCRAHNRQIVMLAWISSDASAVADWNFKGT